MGSFGLGLAIGIGSGMSIGIAIGSDSPAIKKQLKHAIDDNAISIITENGNELSVEQLFDLLKENYKKA